MTEKCSGDSEDDESKKEKRMGPRQQGHVNG